MKICIVAKFFYAERVGGAEVQAWLLARELARRGHTVAYICESLKGRGGSTETIEGIEVTWLFPRPHLSLLGLPQYARALSRTNPQIVIHRYASGYESVIGRFCRRKSVPFVWICTDNATPIRRKFLTGQRKILERHPRPFYKSVALLLHAWAKDLSREYGMRFVTHPCVQNPTQRRAFLSSFGRAPFRFPSGQVIPSKIPIKNSPPIILWVGGFSLVKRPELFLELAQKCKDLDLEFVMISKEVPKDVHTDVEAFREWDQIHRRFTWLVDLPFEEALSWFDRASVLVCTSESEGFPNTFVQAWSRGVPVVSLDVDPNDFIVKHRLGRKVRSLEEVRTAVLGVIADPNLSQLRERLQAFARSRFSIEGVADHLLDLIDRDRPNESDWPADLDPKREAGA